MTKVVVVDYGIGNVLNVCRALEARGAEVTLTQDPAAVIAAPRLVVPGVGAFADGMNKLRERGLVEPIRAFARTGRPYLGICLGLQMMFDRGEEFGSHEGLCLIPGSVVAIAPVGADGRPHKIPHMGWDRIQVGPGRRDWAGTILATTPPETFVYFVHSFTAQPADPACRLADCDYDGVQITAAIQHGKLYGCQFHPEKSGPTGLAILTEFLKIEP